MSGLIGGGGVHSQMNGCGECWIMGPKHRSSDLRGDKRAELLRYTAAILPETMLGNASLTYIGQAGHWVRPMIFV